jgi:hypothetical protein
MTTMKKYTVLLPIEHDGVTIHPAPVGAEPVQVELDDRAGQSLLVVHAVALAEPDKPAVVKLVAADKKA